MTPTTTLFKMASDVAKKAAGTYVQDNVGALFPVNRWILEECRRGSLAKYVRAFCAKQTEIVDPSLVQIEQVTQERIQCRIPCRLFDHESTHAYDAEVRFALNPVTGDIDRQA